jgi:segregation and condensation protein B
VKQINIFMAVLALTIIAFFPAAARADEGMEGLDVTMIVLDGAGDFDEHMNKMDGPDLADVNDDDWEDDEDESEDQSEDESDEDESEGEMRGEFDAEVGLASEDEVHGGFADEFEHDEFDDDDEDMGDDDDFEEGEDVDEDELDDEDEDDDDDD